MDIKEMTKVKFYRLRRECPSIEIKPGKRYSCTINKNGRCKKGSCPVLYWVYEALNYEPANK